MPFSASACIAPSAKVALRMPPPEMHKALRGVSSSSIFRTRPCSVSAVHSVFARRTLYSSLSAWTNDRERSSDSGMTTSVIEALEPRLQTGLNYQGTLLSGHERVGNNSSMASTRSVGSRQGWAAFAQLFDLRTNLQALRADHLTERDTSQFDTLSCVWGSRRVEAPSDTKAGAAFVLPCADFGY